MKKERNKELSKNIVIFGFGKIGTKLILLILIPIFSSYLSTFDYGVSDLVESTVTILIPFLTMGLAHGILRFGIGNKKNGITLLRFSLVISIFGAFLLLALQPFFKLIGLFGNKEIYIPLLFLFDAISLLLANYCLSLGKNIEYSLNGIMASVSLLFFSWLFIVKNRLGSDGYLLAYLFSNVISVIYLSIKCNIFCVFKANKDKKTIRETLRFCIPLVPEDLSWWVIQLSDRYMIAIMCGSAINGIYSMSYKIPGIFNLLVSIFISAFSITVFKEFDTYDKDKTQDVDNKYFENVYSKYLAITFVAVSIVILITQPVAYLFIKNDFYISWMYTPFLLIAFAIGNLQAFFGSILRGIKKTSISFYSTTAGALVNIVLNLCLIPIIQVYGAIIATISSYFVVYLIRLIGLRRHCDINLYTKKTIVSIMLVGIVSLCYTCTLFYIRIFSILISISIVIIYKKEIVEMSSVFYAKIKKILYKLLKR